MILCTSRKPSQSTPPGRRKKPISESMPPPFVVDHRQAALVRAGEDDPLLETFVGDDAAEQQLVLVAGTRHSIEQVFGVGLDCARVMR